MSKLKFLQYEDPAYVTSNSHVRSGISSEGIKYAFTTFTWGHWHPLTWLSLELDSSVYGPDNPIGFHLTNLILHCLNVLLVYSILSILTGNILSSFIAAGIFAVHPQNIETVAWVVERKDLLCTFFFLLSIRIYLSYVRQPSSTKHVAWVATALASYLSKETAIILPAIFFLIDYWPLKRISTDSGRKPLLEKLPLIGLSIAIATLTISFTTKSDTSSPLHIYSVINRLGYVAFSYLSYLLRIFFPYQFTLYYPLPEINLLKTLFCLTGMVLITVWSFSKPHRIVGWLWYVFTLLPVSGVFDSGGVIQGMNDHYAYLPSIGILIILDEEITNILRYSTRYVVPVILSYCIYCSYLSIKQIEFWGSDLAAWQHSEDMYQSDGHIEEELGTALINRGDYSQAELHLKKSVEINSANHIAHMNLGVVYLSNNHLQDAYSEFQKTIEISPNYSYAYFNIALVLKKMGRLNESLPQPPLGFELRVPDTVSLSYAVIT